MTITDTEIQHTIDGYTEAMVWAGLDWSDMDESDNPRPMDERFEGFSDEALREIAEEVTDFLEANEALVGYAADMGAWGWAGVGHDFLLTRNGHGTGFWDRGLGEVGQRLTDACKPYGETNEWLDEEGILHLN